MPIKIPIRKERGSEKMRIGGSIAIEMLVNDSKEAFLVIIPSICTAKTTQVNTASAIKNGGIIALKINLSILRITEITNPHIPSEYRETPAFPGKSQISRSLSYSFFHSRYISSVIIS